MANDMPGVPEKIRNRINVQTIGPLIHHNSGRTRLCRDTFKQREKKAFKKLRQELDELCGGSTGDVIDRVMEYTAVIEEINFNLGIKVGAVLHCELTNNLESDI